MNVTDIILTVHSVDSDNLSNIARAQDEFSDWAHFEDIFEHQPEVMCFTANYFRMDRFLTVFHLSGLQFKKDARLLVKRQDDDAYSLVDLV